MEAWTPPPTGGRTNGIPYSSRTAGSAPFPKRRRWIKNSEVLRHPSSSSSTAPSAVDNSSTTALPPRLSPVHLRELRDRGYVIVPNFLPDPLWIGLRDDVAVLRKEQPNAPFRVARIGQDSTNTLNTDIRVAETCFLHPDRENRNAAAPAPLRARYDLYDVLDAMRIDLQASSSPVGLDRTLTELLYAYYPHGGYYRIHTDAVPGSASILRRYSFLLYLNDPDWDPKVDGGCLRLHPQAVASASSSSLEGNNDNNNAADAADGTSAFNKEAKRETKYVDVVPAGGTLVLFRSDAVPHEVLDTHRERVAVVGWYNRPVQVADVLELSGGGGGPDPVVRAALLLVAAALVTVGVVQIVS
jgi:SM-20-related protein